MQYPNKTFVLEYTHTHSFGTTTHVVIIAAIDKETANQHLNDKLGYKGVPNDLMWLMDTNHPTIYDQTGNKPLEVQAKILYNTGINY